MWRVSPTGDRRWLRSDRQASTVRALIVGADGFVGRWLVQHLVESGDEVHGLVGRHFRPPLHGAVSTQQVDVRDASAVADAVREARPRAVYYLAGVSQPKDRDNLEIAVGVSVVGSLNVLTASASLATPPRILMVGSSHMYASPKDDLPISEDAPLGASSVYGATKAAAEAATLAVATSVGVYVVAARPFNHIGPGQTTSFVVPALAEQIARIAAGASPPNIRAGSLEARRDFTDVRDVVRAYRLMVEKGTAGTAYNIGSGHAISIRDILGRMLAMAGVQAAVSTDDSLLRPAEPMAMVADASRLRRQTGWQPEVGLDQSLRDVVNEALERAGEPVIPGGIG